MSQDEFGKAEMELMHRRGEMEMASVEMERFATRARAAAEADGAAGAGNPQTAAAAAELQARRSDLEAATTALERLKDRGIPQGHPETQKAKSRVDAAQAAVDAAAAQLQELQKQAGATGQVGGTGPRVVVIYDIREYKNFMGDVVELCRGIAGGGQEAVSTKSAGDQASLTVRTTPERQAMIVKMLNLAKRLRANDPKLPGLNVEEVLKGATTE
jgi:hypothetical protein